METKPQNRSAFRLLIAQCSGLRTIFQTSLHRDAQQCTCITLMSGNAMIIQDLLDLLYCKVNRTVSVVIASNRCHIFNKHDLNIQKNRAIPVKLDATCAESSACAMTPSHKPRTTLQRPGLAGFGRSMPKRRSPSPCNSDWSTCFDW